MKNKFVAIERYYINCPTHDGVEGIPTLKFFSRIKDYYKVVLQSLNINEYGSLYKVSTGEIIADNILSSQPGSHKYSDPEFILHKKNNSYNKYILEDDGRGNKIYIRK